MKTVRRLAGKKGATDDEQEDLAEALQLAALEASAVADAATLSSGGSSPRRQQWLADQKDYSIRMNCVVSPFMTQIAAERTSPLSHLFNDQVTNASPLLQMQTTSMEFSHFVSRGRKERRPRSRGRNF